MGGHQSTCREHTQTQGEHARRLRGLTTPTLLLSGNNNTDQGSFRTGWSVASIISIISVIIQWDKHVSYAPPCFHFQVSKSRKAADKPKYSHLESKQHSHQFRYVMVNGPWSLALHSSSLPLSTSTISIWLSRISLRDPPWGINYLSTLFIIHRHELHSPIHFYS